MLSGVLYGRYFSYRRIRGINSFFGERGIDSMRGWVCLGEIRLGVGVISIAVGRCSLDFDDRYLVCSGRVIRFQCN